MAPSSASVEPSSLHFSFPTSFSDLLTSDDYPSTAAAAVSGNKGLGDRIAERTGSGVPKFKSFPPPSLPLSPPPVSPSSYFSIPQGLSPAELLDSPVLLYGSKVLPSPTTGSFFQAFNWMNSSESQGIKQEEDKYQSDFSFQPSISESQATTIPTGQGKQIWNMQESIKQDDLKAEKTTANSDYGSMQSYPAYIRNNSQPNNGFQATNDHYSQSSQTMGERKRSEDGYNWRKYGQKQVKGSENPRSYYKCTFPNCPTKKKVERSLDGQITEIVYKGNHNHPRPQSTRRSSSSSVSSANSSVLIQPYNSHQTNDTMVPSYGSTGNGHLDLVATPDNSSVSIGDGDFEQGSQKSKSIGDEFDDEEPEAKRWKGESENECISAPGNRTIREPRVVVQTTSDIDILDDGYRWRKYGQKVVKGNPNPRSYYKCTFLGCPVRKHVERASHDLRSVITTYEGKHNHDVPAARGSGHNSQSLNKPLMTNSNNNNAAAATRPSVNYASHSLRSNENQVPYTLQMLDSPAIHGLVTSLNDPMSLQQQNGYYKAKEEPRDDLFVESFLC